jgi:hypothetical protein
MDEITITSDDTDTDAVESAAEVVQAVEAAEAGAFAEGIMLGQLQGQVAALQAELETLRLQTMTATASAVEAVEAVEVIEDTVEEIETALIVDAVEDAVEDTLEADTLDQVTDTLDEVADTVESVEDELTPASRREHWFFRPQHEWRRD